MALFLGAWNVPTNKKLRVNHTDVETVYCNGVVVWQYVKGSTTTPGGLPTAGAKGHWIDTGKTIGYLHGRTTAGLNNHIVGALGYGEKQGGLKRSVPDNGKTPSIWYENYAIMRWIPA